MRMRAKSVKRATKTRKAVKQKKVQPIAAGKQSAATSKIKQLEAKLKRLAAAKKRSDQLLQQTRDNFEEVLLHIPSCVYWKDLNGVFLGCNRYAAELMGQKSPKKIIGKTDYDFWAPEEADAFRQADKDVMKAGHELTLEESGKSVALGRKTTFLSTKTPLRDKRGHVIGILGVSMDITEHKRLATQLTKAKLAAQQQKKLTETIIAELPCHVYWKDQRGIIRGCNDLQAKSAGFNKAADIIGKSDYELPWKASADELNVNDQKVIEQGENIIVEETIELANGEARLFRSYKSPLLNSKSQAVGIVGVSFDITEQKQMEYELAQAKAAAEKSAKTANIYLKNIIANLPGHIYWKDKQGVFLGCNALQAKNAGFASSAELIGKTDYELPWREQANVLREIDKKVMATKEKITLEEVSLLSDGKLATFLSHKVPLSGENNEIIGVLGISIDITERKQMEQDLKEAKEKAEQAMLAKSDFLASMAHDLRTPMNGMYGMAQIIKQHVTDPSLAENFEGIEKSKQLLERLINNILNYTKLEAGKFELVSESFNFRQLIQDAVMMVTHQANQKGIHLLVNYPDDIPRHLISDPHCLRGIIMNLIGNAVKYTEHGHVWISVSCEQIIEKIATLKFIVEDSGIGIPADKLNTVFERFTRVHSNESKYQGTGLGLAIVKELAEKLGGTVGVSSVLGQGTTFYAVIPFEMQSVTTKQSPWRQRYADVAVLVVDEEARRGNRILEHLGTSNGRTVTSSEALTVLLAACQESKPYSLVIIDDEVNDEANTLAQTIRANADLNNILLVLLSKPAKLSDIAAAKAAGFFGQLIKPVQPTELTNGIIRLWQEWQIAQQTSAQEQLKRCAPKVLLIEDDMISQHIAKTFLQNLGCQVDAASNGKEALALLNEDHDIVFTDLGLPDMDGIALTQAIRNKEGSDYPTPIIALTGRLEDEDKQKCLSAGMNGFLGKPVEEDQLQALLVRWVLGIGAEKENLLQMQGWID